MTDQELLEQAARRLREVLGDFLRKGGQELRKAADDAARAIRDDIKRRP